MIANETPSHSKRKSNVGEPGFNNQYLCLCNGLFSNGNNYPVASYWHWFDLNVIFYLFKSVLTVHYINCNK